MKGKEACKYCGRDHSRDPLLTTRNVADILGKKDIRTVRTYIGKGVLAGEQGPGGQYGITAAELCRFLHEPPGGGPRKRTDLPSPDDVDDLLDGLAGRA